MASKAHPKGSIRAALDAARARRRAYTCRVAAVLDQLAPDDRAALEAALADPSWSKPEIVEAVSALGVTAGGEPMTLWSVGQHRAMRCACAKGR